MSEKYFSVKMPQFCWDGEGISNILLSIFEDFFSHESVVRSKIPRKYVKYILRQIKYNSHYGTFLKEISWKQRFYKISY